MAGCAGDSPNSTVEFDGSYDTQVVHNNGFGLSFLLRNTSQGTYHYDDSYRLERYADGQWLPEHARESTGAAFTLPPGVVRQISPQWGLVISPGRYKFLMSGDVAVEFDELAWDGDIAPVYDYRQGMLDFMTAGKTSENIVLSGEPEASPTGISFSLKNQSRADYGYGNPYELARYEDGRWLAVPYTSENIAWTLPMFTLRAGKRDSFAIEWAWAFGALPPGRYLFLREFNPLEEYFVQSDGEFEKWDNLHNRYPTAEYLMIEFTIV
ncbi:MAG: hypothetical protein FWC27_02790 [Firmicutes bacterium]|nr:hypothetical protein [Bacillota bacterium]